MPKYLRTDSHKLSTCSDQFKVSSNVIPRYLNEVTRLMSINSVVISTKLWGIGLLTVWKNMKFVLLAFIVSLLTIHHLFSSLNLLMISRVRVFTSGWCINRAVSSAINHKHNFARLYYIYHKCILQKNNGPRTDPCGTPHVTFLSAEFTPLITVYCCLSER